MLRAIVAMRRSLAMAPATVMRVESLPRSGRCRRSPRGPGSRPAVLGVRGCSVQVRRHVIQLAPLGCSSCAPFAGVAEELSAAACVPHSYLPVSTPKIGPIRHLHSVWHFETTSSPLPNSDPPSIPIPSALNRSDSPGNIRTRTTRQRLPACITLRRQLPRWRSGIRSQDRSAGARSEVRSTTRHRGIVRRTGRDADYLSIPLDSGVAHALVLILRRVPHSVAPRGIETDLDERGADTCGPGGLADPHRGDQTSARAFGRAGTRARTPDAVFGYEGVPRNERPVHRRSRCGTMRARRPAEGLLTERTVAASKNRRVR